MAALEEIIGTVFGSWTVLRFVGKSKWGMSLFECRCICGTKKVVQKGSLTSGKSSGCRKCYEKRKVVDLSGKCFGFWLVLGRAANSQRQGKDRPLGVLRWTVRCACGHEQTIEGSTLTKGTSTKCLSCSGNVTHDITGKTIGFWTVIKRGPNSVSGAMRWHVRCRCGRIFLRQANTLNATESTRCLHCGPSLNGAAVGTALTRKSFHNAKYRCRNENATGYKNYGGRGIEFRFNSVEELVDDIGQRPGREWSIDRINNDGHYEVGNVRWATQKEQARNRRSLRA